MFQMWPRFSVHYQVGHLVLLLVVWKKKLWNKRLWNDYMEWDSFSVIHAWYPHSFWFLKWNLKLDKIHKYLLTQMWKCTWWNITSTQIKFPQDLHGTLDSTFFNEGWYIYYKILKIKFLKIIQSLDLILQAWFD